MGIFKSLKRRSQVSKLLREYKELLGRSDDIARIKAEELTILLDELKVWELHEYIPHNSYLIPAVKPGVPSVMDLIRLVAHNRRCDQPTRGKPYTDKVIRLKHRKTGIIVDDKNPS